jgi:hypothetical protein
MLTRRDESSRPESCFYQPMIAIIVQGWKRAMIGNREYSYGEGSCMVVGVDMPGVYHITKALADRPFLSVSIKLDKYVITRLLAEAPHCAEKNGSSPGAVVVSEVTGEILDAFLRLVRLLETDDDTQGWCFSAYLDPLDEKAKEYVTATRKLKYEPPAPPPELPTPIYPQAEPEPAAEVSPANPSPEDPGIPLAVIIAGGGVCLIALGIFFLKRKKTKS